MNLLYELECTYRSPILLYTDFPRLKYYIQNLYGCPNENGGGNNDQKSKCNLFLHVHSNEYVSLEYKGSAFEVIATGKGNLYKIKYGNKYLTYHTKVSNWIVVDDSDSYMTWEILPRGGGYSIRSKYNCQSWPCNEELTTGNAKDRYLWLESGWYQAFKLIPVD